MKNIIVASTILALFAGVASASSIQPNERPDVSRSAPITVQSSEQVQAKSLYSDKELQRAGLNATDIVNLTVIPSNGAVESLGGDN